MAALFEAYITNLGKYNEGELVGETLKFPTSPQAVEALLKNIGVDGIRYGEFFITSFDGDVLGLYDYLGEYENLDELNHLACLLSELPQSEIEKFEAALHMGAHTSSVADIINLAENLDTKTIQKMVDAAPDAERYCTDGYSGYLDVVFPGKHIFNIHNKNDTFTVEGVNADLRHYIPTLARRSRCFPRKLENLQAVLAVFVRAYNRFGFQKHRYRSRHPGSSVPFSLFDFL